MTVNEATEDQLMFLCLLMSFLVRLAPSENGQLCLEKFKSCNLQRISKRDWTHQDELCLASHGLTF